MTGEPLTPPPPRSMQATCAREVLSRIEGGQYPPGEWLPMMRVIGRELGMSTATVGLAFRGLAQAGHIVRVDKVGYYPAGERPAEDPPRPGNRTEPHAEITEGRLADSYLTLAEVAKILRVGKMTIYRGMAEFGALRVGERTYRFPVSAVERYLASCVVVASDVGKILEELNGEDEAG